MKVTYEGLLKILYRRHKSIYTKEKLIELINSDGASVIDNTVTYLGYGIWEVRA